MKITNFITKTQNGILAAAMVISMANALNAVMGFLKGRLLANYFGVSEDLAIFYTADRIPNLIYSVLVVGAVSTVFIPVFTEILKKDEQKAFKSASSIVTATILLFVLAGAIVYALAPQTINLLALGKFTSAETSLGASLMRIMLLAQVLLVLGSLATSVLQSFKYFLIPALAPVFYNVGMILGIVFLSERYGIYGPTYGVVLGSLLHVAIQIPLMKKTGMRFKLALDFRDPSLKEMLKLVPPRILSVSMAHLVGTINNSLAILISTPSVIFLKFATQLQTFPVTLFGLAMASAILPTLSKESDKDNLDNFKQTLLTTLHQTMFLVLPLSVILLVLRVPVVRIVYGVSNFPWEATVKTSYALAFFSISIFAQSANYLLSRAFYALKDTKTPVIINLVTIFINIILSIYFVTFLKLGVWAIALSYTLTSLMDLALYVYYLDKKVGGFDPEKLIIPFIKTSFATLCMGIFLYLPLKFLDTYIFDTTQTIQLVIVTGIAGTIGMCVYLLLTKLFKVEEIELFYKILIKLRLMKTQLPTQVQE
jgi:putative peptidoglycan lipid II flippase